MKLARISISAMILSLAACDVGEVAPGGPGITPPPTSGEGRVLTGLAGLFTFEEGGGGLINDTSRAGAPIQLEISEPEKVTWLPGGGISLSSPVVIATPGPVAQVSSPCMASNAITVEAWVKPASVIQEGPARIFTYSAGPNSSNFTLGQSGSKVVARLRTTETDETGNPATETLGNAFVNTTDVFHIAYTRNGAEDMGYVYVNGFYAGEAPVAGNFSNWNMDHQLVVGNELNGQRPWVGEIHLAAVYCRDLTAAEIKENFDAGY